MTRSQPSTDAHRGDELMVVGIGASAGGVQACRAFFAATRPDDGIAYVVILHLSPDHDSQLAEVLQHTTSMPVRQVSDDAPVEPNHVYVIPPNRRLTINDGRLELSEPTRAEDRRTPVDVFMRTLADARRAHAACVILSGTGANGSSGLRRVKERGGIVVAQAPDEAQHDDMPRHAIATGLVDIILPVAEIPARIRAYRDSLSRVQAPASSSPEVRADDPALREVLTQLRLRTGHDFGQYKRASLLRRIERRLGIHQLQTLAEYADVLRREPGEPAALLRDLLISVTQFFRDPEIFELLDAHALAPLFEGRRADQPLRAWVAGCATGEEAYSIAMLLAERAEAAPDPPPIQVFATDLDERAVAYAREGLYTETEVADVSPERLRRFFNREERGFRVRRELRERVLFAHHNLLRDAPFSRLDLVSCRNLLIYLERPAQQRLIEVFHFALNPGGFLFLGTSESTEQTSGLFHVVHKDAHLHQSRGVRAAAGLLQSEIPAVGAPGRVTARDHALEAKARDRRSHADLHHRLLERYGPPSLVVNEDHQIVHLSEHAGRYLTVGGGDMSTNLLLLIRPDLRLELRTALYQAAQTRAAVEAHGLAVTFDSGVEIVNLVVRPSLAETEPLRGYFLVVFEPVDGESGLAAAAEPLTQLEPARHLEAEVLRLRAQLSSTVEQYETQTEESRAANEELQAVNEELRSSAEELETSKEELQSINEELTTVNQELKIKIDELGQANNDFQNLINAIDIGVIFLDRQLRVKLFTPRARDGFNLIPTDVGRPLSDITTTFAYDDLNADVERVLERLQVIERELTARNGRSVLIRLLPYRTADDRILGVVLIIIDTTQLKRVEARVRSGEERLRLLIESAEEHAIFTLDPDNHIDSWNIGAERVFGYTSEEILGQSGAVLFPRDDRAAGVPEAEQQRARDEGRADHEGWQLRKDGTRVWCSSVMRPLHDGQLIGFAKIAQDLTRRQRAAADLRDAQDHLEARVRARTSDLESDIREHQLSEERTRQLLRHVVTAQEDERRRISRDLHDQLGQQLTALRLALDGIAGSAGTGLDGRLQFVRETAERLDGEVDFLARELRPAALDDLGLAAALEQYVGEWSRHYGIEATCHAHPLELRSELEVTLYRITQEALNNVVKHAHASRVEVLIEARADDLVLIIEDDGVGFKPEEVAGRGLGLLGISERASIVQGSVEIESSPGQGATLFVRVPLHTTTDHLAGGDTTEDAS